jgi:hypothetical protein
MKLCHYAECRDLFIGMLNVIMLNVIMLNVVATALIISGLLRDSSARMKHSINDTQHSITPPLCSVVCFIFMPSVIMLNAVVPNK